VNVPSDATKKPIVVLLREDVDNCVAGTSSHSIPEARAALGTGSVSVMVTDVHVPEAESFATRP
jgi:hypothetical protein